MNKEKFKDYICVICSTQNQMVNYIPIKEFGFKKILNLTVVAGSRFNNKQWDENLIAALKNCSVDLPVIENIEFKQSEVASFVAIKNRLEKFIQSNSSPVFWNITGGQRPFIMAMNSIYEKRKEKYSDVLCYIEGNTSKLQLITKKPNNFEDDLTLINYEIKSDISIDTVLKLSGFKEFATTLTKNDFLKENISLEKEEYLGLTEKMISDLKKGDDSLRLLLNITNKKGYYSKEKGFGTGFDKIKDDIESKIKNHKIITNALEHSNAFGYLFEYMFAYEVVKCCKENKLPVKNIAFSTGAGFDNEDSGDAVDQFDLIIMKDNGQLLIFECKSGVTGGDVAKSHKYSTYAISGVYGLPILVLPLLRDEIDFFKNANGKKSLKVNSDNTGNRYDYMFSEEEFKDKIKNRWKEVYSVYSSAIVAATHANLEVWGIDEIETKLEELLKI